MVWRAWFGRVGLAGLALSAWFDPVAGGRFRLGAAPLQVWGRMCVVAYVRAVVPAPDVLSRGGRLAGAGARNRVAIQKG